MNHRSNKKRGYLLPKGCKDLIDVLNPKVEPKQKSAVRTIPLPPIVGEMTLPDQMTVGELADALKQKPSRIIADFMRLFGKSVTMHQTVYPHDISQVIRLYGFTLKDFP